MSDAAGICSLESFVSTHQTITDGISLMRADDEQDVVLHMAAGERLESRVLLECGMLPP